MIDRGGEDFLEEAEAESTIGVNEESADTLYGERKQVHLGRKSEEEDRTEAEEAHEEIVERVGPVGREPVHLFDGVVHGVEAPDDPKFMTNSVAPVESELFEQKDGEEGQGHPDTPEESFEIEEDEVLGISVTQRDQSPEQDYSDKRVHEEVQDVVERAAANRLKIGVVRQEFETPENQGVTGEV